jgi:DNA (cytosine-5)-methyltransferase 1
MTKAVRSSVTAISLFTGCGGMDLGFAREGFDIRVAVELDPAACATLRRNWPSHTKRLLERPLEAVSTRELLRVARLRVGEADIVLGGPPCQSWCVAGNRRGFDDPRGQALLEFCRVVRESKPRAFCIENVPGLLSYSDIDIPQVIVGEINRGLDVEYQIAADVLNAAEYGVPQQRKRVFIVGWRTPGEFFFPAPSHQTASSFQRPWKRPARTVGEALEGLPSPSAPSSIAHRVAMTIPGRNERWYGKK